MLQRLRMRLALWLDRRHPDWCWATLCTDLALGWDLWHWRENAKNISVCRMDCERNGSCWCGKLHREE